MPKIRYLHKSRQRIFSIYPQKSVDILQNMNFSRYYRNRGKIIYGFDPSIIRNKNGRDTRSDKKIGTIRKEAK